VPCYSALCYNKNSDLTQFVSAVQLISVLNHIIINLLIFRKAMVVRSKHPLWISLEIALIPKSVMKKAIKHNYLLALIIWGAYSIGTTTYRTLWVKGNMKRKHKQWRSTTPPTKFADEKQKIHYEFAYWAYLDNRIWRLFVWVISP